MISAIIYILIYVFSIALFMLIPKTMDGHKISIFTGFITSYVSIKSLQVILAYFLSKLGISVSLSIMICITLLILVGEILVFVKKYKLKKEYQKYDVDVLDTVNYGVIIAILIVVIYRIFSVDLNFNYINTDPAVHFGQAVKFAIKGKVSNMPYSAVFNGTFIKLFLCIFPGVKTYKVFILADSFSNFLSGAFFYILFKEIVTNKVVKKLSPLFTALYFVGWPVYNYVQGGFVYWGMGAYLIMFGLYLIIKHNKDEISLKVLFCALFVDLIDMSLCYMMFAPYVVVMFGVVLLQMYWSKIPDKKKLIRISVIAILICMVAVFAFVMVYFKGNIGKVFYWLAVDGGIHRSLYKDLIFFLPFEVLVVFDMVKNKKLNIVNVSFLIFTIMVLASLVFELTGIMSSYYYYKLYYPLWILGWLNTALGLEIVIKEKQQWVIGYLLMIFVMLVYSFTPLEEWEYNSYGKNAYKQSPEFPMYSNVGSFIKNHPENWAYPREEDFFDVVDYVIKLGEPVPELGVEKNGYWYKKMSGSVRFKETEIGDVEKNFFEEELNESKYFCIEKSTNYYKNNKESLARDYEIIYEADYGVIYQKR